MITTQYVESVLERDIEIANEAVFGPRRVYLGEKRLVYVPAQNMYRVITRDQIGDAEEAYIGGEIADAVRIYNEAESRYFGVVA